MPCTPGETAACEGDPAYGAGFFCGESSRCTTSCVDLFDCLIAGRLCGPMNTCEACVGPDACEEAGYEAGTPCVAGVCVEDSCVSSAQCVAKVPERPVCGSDGHCRTCQANAECDGALGVDAICVATGRCVAGDCGGVDAVPCSGGLVCKANTCQACAGNAECGAWKCIDGTCQDKECNAEKPCEDGRVCTTDHFCRDCTADDTSFCTSDTPYCNVVASTCVECTERAHCSAGSRICDTFACRDCLDGECSANEVCVDGGCVAGDCKVPGDACDTNRVCGADRWCGACDDLADCLAAYGADHVCDAGVCVPGTCVLQADCTASGTLCVDHACTPCTSLAEPDAACGFAFGSDRAGHSWLCEDTVCIPGDCHDQSQCNPSKTICASDHFCTPCDDAQFGAMAANHDEACHQAWGSTRVCEPDPEGTPGEALCEPGCDAPDRCTQGDLDAGTDCALDQVCGADHRWRDCTEGPDGDAECAAAGAASDICEPDGRDGRRCQAGCTSSATCASAGQVCDQGDHRCRPCADNAECGDYPGAYLCIDGSCEDKACNAEKPCADGRVCNAAHACVDCSASDASYCGATKVCDVEVEACVECTSADDHVCSGAGKRCRVETKSCVDCLGSADCSGGARICEAFACRDCLPGECALAQVCVGGGCVAGDKACAQAGATCDDDADGQADEVCGDDHFCRACQSDGECVTASGDANRICEAGACAAGCTPGTHDASGKICGDDHRWRACDGDTECSSSYANPARICKTGACVLGCPDASCQSPTVCGVDHRCTTCNLAGDDVADRDKACADRYGEGTVCKGTICDLGCWPGTYCTAAQQADGECILGQICDASRHWRACTADAECATAYGVASKICEGDVCSNGCPTVTCALDKGCGADHRCSDCALAGSTTVEHDAVCKTAHGSEWICNEGANTCEPGCTPGTACFSNPDGFPWVCATDNRCQPCGDGVLADTACKGAYKDLYFTCTVDHSCAVQCKPGLQSCGDGRICSAGYKCIDCQDVTDDAKCVRDYGAPQLCIDNACEPIECRSDTECASKNPTEPVCLLGYCVGCTQPDPDVPRGDCAEGQVCLDDGRCVAGECESTAWCVAHAGPGFQCVNYQCVGCNQDADCVSLLKLNDARYSCLSEVGSCDVVEHRCLERSSLDVEVGCFLEVRTQVGTPGEFQCFDAGAPYPIATLLDYACLQCDPLRSRHWWTPGSVLQGGVLVDHCFVDRATKPTEPFVSDPEATHTFPWVQGQCIVAATFTEAPTSWPHPARVDDEGRAWTDACNTCNPDEYANRFRWSWTPDSGAWLPAGGDPSLFDLRVDCDRPLFSPWGESDPAATAAWSGSSWGTCWQGECRGLSWTPWLPLGPAGAVDTVLDAVPKGGATYDLTSSFGGGFGSGVPHANPGCYGVACP